MYDDSNERANLILVHGGAHAAWCWDRLVPFPQTEEGVGDVVAIDLAGHGERADVKPLEEISLRDYVDDVVDEIEGRDFHDVVLVGHSLAGITLPLVAARVPERIRRLVFLTTSNPPPGESIADLMKHPLSPVARGADARAMFCNDLDESSAEWLLSRLGAEPPGPMKETITTAKPPAGVESTYILCERDEALPPAYQREQAENAGIDDIVSFDADHSAFVSRPQELAALLARLARRPRKASA